MPPQFAPAVIGRFAPSPTGPLHFGSLVSALASYLSARSSNGRWLVRIEDVDTPRTVAGSACAILHLLERLALHWDGPVVCQSNRTSLYHAAFERLKDANLVYPCTCSRAEIASHSPTAIAGVYPGWCRNGPRSPERVPAWRLRTPDSVIAFNDRFQGVIHQAVAQASGDFVVLRSDGLFAYQLAVVVDDACQGVTEVVRGADLLDSTARQIHLLHCLGLTTPQYGHVPLAVTPGGHKLSKREQAPMLDPAQGAGALVAALEFLGQRPAPGLERATPATVVEWALEHWKPAAVPPATAIEAATVRSPDLA